MHNELNKIGNQFHFENIFLLNMRYVRLKRLLTQRDTFIIIFVSTPIKFQPDLLKIDTDRIIL